MLFLLMKNFMGSCDDVVSVVGGILILYVMVGVGYMWVV